MTLVHDSGWHPLTITLVEGCRDGGRLCTSHCPEPCEDETQIELDCDAQGCPAATDPDTPRCSLAASLDYYGPDDLLADTTAPGTFQVRHLVTEDYQGERDEVFEVRDAPTNASTRPL